MQERDGMKIHFIGSTLFSIPILMKLESLVEITGVTTRMSETGDDFDLGWLYRPYPTFTDHIPNQKPDYIWVTGWHQIVPDSILSIAPTIGYHPAPLPKGRGHCPIIHAIADKWESTASTFFWMTDKVDAGNIIAQEMVPILEGDTTKTLYMRLMETALKQVDIIISRLSIGNLVGVKQDESEATYLPMRKKGVDKWIGYW